MGGITQGGEVRCDAKAVGHDSLTTAGLVESIVTAGGGTVDSDAMTALDVAAPYLIGWYTSTEPVNRLAALDEIMAGIGGYWGTGADETITAGVIAAPASTASLALTNVEITSLRLARLVPPAWRIRCRC